MIKNANQARTAFKNLRKNVLVANSYAKANVNNKDINDMRLAMEEIHYLLKNTDAKFKALRDFLLDNSMAYKRIPGWRKKDK